MKVTDKTKRAVQPAHSPFLYGKQDNQEKNNFGLAYVQVKLYN